MITPASTFYTQKQIDKINKLRDGFKEKSADELKGFLTKIHIQPIDKFRLALLAISFELSDRGLAPRWQGVTEAPATEEQSATIAKEKSDATIIDLYWLVRTFPKHRTSNGRWNQLFESGFDLALAASITDVQHHCASKVIKLDITPFQQYGCIALHRFKARKNIVRALQASKIKQFKTSNWRNNKTPKQIEEHTRLVIFCAKLGDCSPSKTADVFQWVTGKRCSRQNMHLLITKNNIKPFKS